MESAAIGARIRQAREAKGLSQEELAVGVSRSQKAISQYENGTRRMFANDLPQFAEALNVPVSFFFTGKIIIEDFDEIILTECQRLKTIEAKQALLQFIRVFADFALFGQKSDKEY